MEGVRIQPPKNPASGGIVFRVTTSEKGSTRNCSAKPRGKTILTSQINLMVLCAIDGKIRKSIFLKSQTNFYGGLFWALINYSDS